MKNYIRRKVYRWHRITSLVIAVPVLLWTLSGFLHPVMNSFRPKLLNNGLPAHVIDTSTVKLSVKEALNLHGITSIHTFRIVELYGAQYYQVQIPHKDTMAYISCYNGQMLPRGDQQYAASLAQRYVSDPEGGGNRLHHAAADLAGLVSRKQGSHMRSNTLISEVELVKEFDQEYKSSNVLLPVYRVSFQRDDNLRLYVETSTGRLSVAMNDTRAWFTRFFAITHSWSFMNGLGAAKHVIVATISLLCLLSAVSGFYVYNLVKKKPARTGSTRSLHRAMGNVFVVTTLLYAFSGGWHSFHKLIKVDDQNREVKTLFMSDDLPDPRQAWQHLPDDDTLLNIMPVRIHSKDYWQLTSYKEKKVSKSYLHMHDLRLLKDGDDCYARYLASVFANSSEGKISGSSQLNRFSDRYSMMKKRLPVVEVNFKEGKNYFIETSTGQLAAIGGKTDAAERFSFSNLHMHHYWEDWFGRKRGKSLKHIFLVTTTLGLLLLAATGMLMYLRKRKSIEKPQT